MEELPNLAGLSLACKKAPPTGPQPYENTRPDPYWKPHDFQRAQWTTPGQHERHWKASEDTRPDGAMDNALWNANKDNYNEFVEGLIRDGRLSPQEVADLTRQQQRLVDEAPAVRLARLAAERDGAYGALQTAKTRISVLEQSIEQLYNEAMVAANNDPMAAQGMLVRNSTYRELGKQLNEAKKTRREMQSLFMQRKGAYDDQERSFYRA